MSLGAGFLLRMQRKRKILIFLGAGLLLFLCAAAAGLVFLIESPGKFKTLVEQSLSKATGAECSIKGLSYSLNPLVIHATGIQLIDHVQWFYLEIPELVTKLSLQGPIGRKSLVVKHLTIRGLSLNTYRSSSLMGMQNPPAAAGFFARLGRDLVGLLFFRDIHIEDAEISGGHMNSEIGGHILTLGGIRVTLNERKSLEIACYGRVRWGSEQMEMTMPNIQLTADKAISIVDPEIRMSLKGEDMTFVTPMGRAQTLSGQAQAVYDRDKKVLTLRSARLSSKNLTLKQRNGAPSPLLTMHLEADGFLDFFSGKAGAQRFHLILHERMEATGTVRAEMRDRPEVTVNGLVLKTDLRYLWPLVPDTLGMKRPPFTLGGVVHVTGSLHGVREGDAWQWDGDLHARLKDNPVSVAMSDTQAHGMATADIQVKGLFPAVETTLTFALDQAAFTGKGMEVKSARAFFAASGKGLDFDFQNANVEAPLAEILLAGKRLQALDIKARLQNGTIHFSQKKLNFPKIDIHSSLITNIQLSVDAQDGQITVGLQGKEVQLFSLAEALSILPSDWHLEGVNSFSMKGLLEKNGHWLLDSKWNCDRLAFQSPDSVHAGEKIGLQLRLAATGDMSRPGLTASVEGSAEKGGFLYDRIYLDLNRNSLQVQARGHYDFSSRTADLSGFKFVLKDLLALEAEGQLADPASETPSHLLVHVPQIPVKPVFQFFFKEPLKQEVPLLAELDMAGDFLAEMEFQKGAEGWSLLGHCSWHHGEILGKSVTLEGIQLDLPFWGGTLMDFAESHFRSRSPFLAKLKKEGSLSIQSIGLPYLPRQSFAAQVLTTPNLIAFIPQDSIKALGGEIELGPLSLNGLFTLSPSLVTSATLKGIDLGPMLFDLWSRPIPGSIRGKLDFLQLDGRGIQTRGDLKVSAYGGEMVLSNPGASGILSPTPMFFMDARWNNLNLGKLTKGTPFEKVEGVLQGQAKNLEVVAGEPQRFDLFMETVETKEVPQRMSVRAVESIAQIGGGASPFMGLAGTFTSFFNEFPYDKIAIQASLENDVFRIDGPMKEGDKVYLVKRSGFSGVNVVNQDPDRHISFKDMVKRIKRVTAGGESPPGEEENSKSEKQELR